MKRGRPKKRKTNNSSLFPRLLLLVFLFVFMFSADKIVNQFRQAQETPKTFVKKVPPKIAEQLSASPLATHRVPILMYHYVEYVEDRSDTTRMSLNINPNIFEAQIKTLHDNNFTFMTASELAEALDGKRELPKKPVLITIDDGHWDVDTIILPILRKYNARATAYIPSGFVDNDSDFLTKKQLKDLVDSGLVEIGAHTVHHISLKGKLSPIVDYEVIQSKKDLEQDYAVRVTSFAYPDGAFDEKAMNAVEKAGFTSAVSTIPGIQQGIQNKYFLFRLRPGYRTGQDLINYFNQTSFKNW